MAWSFFANMSRPNNTAKKPLPMRIHSLVPFILPHPFLHRRPMLLSPVLLPPRRYLIPPSRHHVPTTTTAHHILPLRLLRRRPPPPPPQKQKQQPRRRHHPQRNPHRQPNRQVPPTPTPFIHPWRLPTPRSRRQSRHRRRRRRRRRHADARHPPGVRRIRLRHLDDGLLLARGERERVAGRVARAAAGFKVGLAAEGGGGLAGAAEGGAGDEVASLGVVVCVGVRRFREGERGGYRGRSSRRRCCPISGWCRRRA